MIIIANTGSTSKKYSVYEKDTNLISFIFEKVQGEYILHEIKGNNVKKDTVITNDQYDNAFNHVIDSLVENSYIKLESDIKAVVFRIVAPGTYFTFDRVIDDEFLLRLDDIREQAPLHIDDMRKEFEHVEDRLPETKLVGISDSRFHKSMKSYASEYAIPKKIREGLDIKKFGYHGISVSSVVNLIKEEKGDVPERIIICHLGGGSSITAIKNGMSLDTSMGYTPLEGVPMSTRVGNIDAGAIIAIQDELDLDIPEIRDMLYYKSGMKALGGSEDMRDLLSAEDTDDEAKMALNNFVYSIKKYIGSYYAILGGLDMLVFTGTMGEKANKIRKYVCEGLEHLGIELDSNLNNRLDGDGYINVPGSDVVVEVLSTREEEEMTKRALDLL